MHALAATSIGGTVVCLNPVQLTTSCLTIVRSVTIDCSNGPATLNVFGADSNFASFININVPANDAMQTVRLIGFSMDGAGAGGRFIPNAIVISAGGSVTLENLKIEGMLYRGIFDRRTGAQSKLLVRNSQIRGSGGPAIVSAAAAVSGAVFDNLVLTGNGYGIAVASGNNVVVRDSVISYNTTAGVQADSGAQINMLNSALSHNATNVNAYGLVRLKENDIQFSNVAIQGGGAVSAGANRFLGNVSVGAQPALLANAPADVVN